MDSETPKTGRRAPWRFFNRGRAAVGTNADRTEQHEDDPDSWADLPAETADDWDATCWFPLDSVREPGRPEFYPIPRNPGGPR